MGRRGLEIRLRGAPHRALPCPKLSPGRQPLMRRCRSAFIRHVFFDLAIVRRRRGVGGGDAATMMPRVAKCNEVFRRRGKLD